MMGNKELIKEMLLSKGKVIAFDLDLTLTKNGIQDWKNHTILENNKALSEVEPDHYMINLVNDLAKNNTIYIFTARSDIHNKVTKDWLDKYNVKYDYFLSNKPHYDFFCDDRAINPVDLKKEKNEG